MIHDKGGRGGYAKSSLSLTGGEGGGSGEGLILLTRYLNSPKYRIKHKYSENIQQRGNGKDEQDDVTCLANKGYEEFAEPRASNGVSRDLEVHQPKLLSLGGKTDTSKYGRNFS